MGCQPFHGDRIQVQTVVAIVDGQRLAHVHGQGQRVVGLFSTHHLTKAQSCRRSLFQGLRYGVVLEYQQTVEQGLTTLSGPTLHLEQWRVLILTQGQVALLHHGDPIAHAQVRARTANDRQGIDEQPDLLLDAG
ncbi:Uncharacterised protein [Acinetobacter baumannii]|nr:Uncharacterised protein [Acinetobacter baumannii]